MLTDVPDETFNSHNFGAKVRWLEWLQPGVNDEVEKRVSRQLGWTEKSSFSNPVFFSFVLS